MSSLNPPRDKARWMNQRIFYKTSLPLFFENTWLGDKNYNFLYHFLIVPNTWAIQPTVQPVWWRKYLVGYSSVLGGQPPPKHALISVGGGFKGPHGFWPRVKNLLTKPLSFETTRVLLTHRLWPGNKGSTSEEQPCPFSVLGPFPAVEWLALNLAHCPLWVSPPSRP